jgi:hypothetical protein
VPLTVVERRRRQKEELECLLMNDYEGNKGKKAKMANGVVKVQKGKEGNRQQ